MDAIPSLGPRSRIKYFGLEVVTIVLGIPLALAADAWWDEHVRQDRELALLLALHEEFATNAAESEQTGRAHMALLNDALSLLEQTGKRRRGQSTTSVAGLMSEYRTDLNNGGLNGYLVSCNRGSLSTESAAAPPGRGAPTQE